MRTFGSGHFGPPWGLNGSRTKTRGETGVAGGGDPKTEGAGLAGLRTVVDEVNVALMKKDGCQEYTMDEDATLILAGKEDANFSYTGEKSDMTMMAALDENGLKGMRAPGTVLSPSPGGPGFWWRRPERVWPDSGPTVRATRLR